MPPIKEYTFVFINVRIIISSYSEDEAYNILKNTVTNPLDYKILK